MNDRMLSKEELEKRSFDYLNLQINSWVSCEELAKDWKVSTRYIRMQCAAGNIKSRKIGGIWWIVKGQQKPATIRRGSVK